MSGFFEAIQYASSWRRRARGARDLAPDPQQLLIDHVAVGFGAACMQLSDEPLAISMLKRIFRANEFEVEEARDGFEAGRKVEVFKPDILLLDLKMPGMSGEEVLREIKSNHYTKHIRVIILSGYVNDEQKKMLLSAGAQGVLDKPINREELLAMVGVSLNKKGE